MLKSFGGFPRAISTPATLKRKPTYVDSDEIFQRLAHLESLYVQMTGVKEVINPRITLMVRLYVGQKEIAPLYSDNTSD